MKKVVLPLIILTSLLAACGNTSNLQAENNNNNTGVISSLSSAKALSFNTNQDWLEGLRVISQTYHAFAGYSFNKEAKEIIIYTANSYKGQIINDDTNEKGRKLGLIKQSFINLMEFSQNVPFVTTSSSDDSIKKWKIKFVASDVSLEDLLSWREALYINPEDTGINGLSFNMDENKLIVHINNETARAKLVNKLNKLNIPENKIDFQYGTIGETKENNTSQYRPVVGGIKIDMPNNSYCTLGLPVTLNGVNGYLTAGHCVTSVGSNNAERFSQGGYPVATKYQDPQLIPCVPAPQNSNNCQSVPYYRFADAVFYKSDITNFAPSEIAMTSNTPKTHTTLQNADGSDKYFDVTSVYPRPSTSEVVVNLGATSGYRSATVTNPYYSIYISVNVNGANVNTWIYDTVQVLNDGANDASCKGDSGSPWFQKILNTTNQVRFYGIQSAADIVPGTNCGSNAYFSPVDQIEKHFGAGKIVYKK